MKKGFILFAALLILAVLPALTEAQGFSGFSWPGRWQVSGCGSSCDPCACPLFDPPIFYVGWMNSSNANFSYDVDSGGGQTWPPTGLWLGLADRINLNCNCGLDLDGWVLIPFNSQGSESQTLLTSRRIRVGNDPPRFVNVAAITTETRNWNTSPDWWYVDAAASCAPCKGVRVLGGFRYEHFSTNFRDPSPVFGLVTTPDDTADFTVNSYLPFVGLQSTIGGPASKISVRLIGFPVAPASVTYSETGIFGLTSRLVSTGNWDRSYFLEFFAEGSLNFSSNMGVGAFVRWNLLHGQGALSTSILPDEGSIDSPGVSFNRNTFTFGASLALNFSNPF